MKLPKQSTVCSMCDEIVTLDKSKPVIYCVAVYNHSYYYMIEDLHWADVCGACFINGDGPLTNIRAGQYDFKSCIVRLGSNLNCLNVETKLFLKQWIKENNGLPQF